MIAIPVAGHAHHAPETLAAIARGHGLAAEPAADMTAAIDAAADRGAGIVLIAGSLYIAGEALVRNDQCPE